MPDEMFFSKDMLSMYRGKRREARTETCRPCIIWSKDAPEVTLRGVMVDVSPYGVCIRMLDSLPSGTRVMVQLMRDESFRRPFAPPLEGIVVRTVNSEEGFVDHGIELHSVQANRTRGARPTQTLPRRRPGPRRKASSRMHTLDITLGDRRSRT